MTDPEDRSLQELGSEAYVEDRGFTEAVVARLPPGQRSVRRPILLTCALLSAGLLAFNLTPVEPWLSRAVGFIATFPAPIALALAAIILVGFELERA